MRTLLLRPRADLWWVIGIAVVALLVFGASAVMDPDPHHDGVQIVPAIAVSEGIPIHLGVYDHYGPATAWLHAAAVSVIGPKLLTIRLVTAVLLVLAAVLLLRACRLAEFSSGLSTLVVAVWIALWPGRSVDPVTYLFLPWPSITVLVLTLVALLMTLRLVSVPRSGAAWSVGLGVVLGCAVVARPNGGFSIAFVSIMAVVLLTRLDRRSRMMAALRIMAGGAVPLFVTAGVLVVQGAAAAFIRDTIIGPLSGHATDGATPWFFYKNVVLLGSIPTLVALVTIVLAARVRPLSRWWPLVLAVVGIASLTTVASTAIPGNPLRNVILARLTWAPALDHQAFQLAFVVALITPILGLSVLWWTWRESRRISPRTDGAPALSDLSPHLQVLVVLGLFALAALTQLFPFIDPNHLWWALPVPLLFVLAVLRSGLEWRWQRALVAVLLVPPLVVSLPRAVSYFAEPRERIQSGVLSGMLIEEERFGDVLKVDALLGGLPPASTDFDCWNGLFAAWNGTYTAATAAFVNWTPSGVAHSDNAVYRVRCTDPEPNGSIGSLEIPQGFEVLDTIGPVSLSYYNYTYLTLMKRM